MTNNSNDRTGNLAKMFTIMRREFVSRVKTKGFIIGTIILPVFIIVMTIVPGWLASRTSDQKRTVYVIDQTGEIFNSFEQKLDAKNDKGERLYELRNVQVAPEDLESNKAAFNLMIENGELDYYLIIPADVDSANSATIFGKSVSNFRGFDAIRNALSNAVVDRRFTHSAFDPEQIRRLMTRVDLVTKKASADGEKEESILGTLMIAWVLVFFLYMAVILYGQVIMRSVIEEKTSRVVESVISSIKPFYLMAGKVLGVGGVGLLQFLIWAAAAGAASLYGAGMAGMLTGNAEAASAIPTIPLSVLGYFVLFFVLGYFLYATLYAGVGSLVNSDQEAQQFAMPITMMIVIPLIVLWNIIGNPDGQMAMIFSFIPFFAPLVMFARIVVQTPPLWQILAVVAILVSTILGTIWLVGKIFRVGVLMYGKRPTLPEIVKWLRYA